MYLLRAVDIKKEYGTRTLFDIDHLELDFGGRVGLIGANGSGKSTLLSVLSGRMEPDSGSVDARGVVAVIEQEPELSYLKERQGGIDRSTGFFRDELSEKPSGGELTRAAIAAALSASPDILMADEPTTNLDMDGIKLLERVLTSFRGALLLVSHDRALLDAVCDRIWEIEEGRVRVFNGNYSAWCEQKNREREFDSWQYDEYRREKKRLERAAQKASERAHGSLKAPSRMSASEARLCGNKNKGTEGQAAILARSKTLQRRALMLEEKERPGDLPEIKMQLGSALPLRSPFAVRGVDLSIVFENGRELFRKAAFEIPSGRKTVLLGPNGSGKSTLIAAIRDGREGIKRSPALKEGYFSQAHENLDFRRTVLENAQSLSAKPQGEVRTILARLGLYEDDVRKPVSILSGGQRAKVVFAMLLASELNMLILDEPTNHIDIYTLEALEALLSAWQGTLLLVTHDRRLAENVGDRFMTLSDGDIKTVEGKLVV